MNIHARQEDNKKLICTKHDIYLYKICKKDNTFMIVYDTKPITEPDVVLDKIQDIGYFYKLLATLNPDVLTNTQIIQKYNVNSLDVLVQFKHFAKELGIKAKSMCLHTEYKSDGPVHAYISKSIIKNRDELNLPLTYDLVTCEESIFTFSIKNNKQIHIEYCFNLDLEEDLPIYMENLAGILMKKIFFRLKEYIEKH